MLAQVVVLGKGARENVAHDLADVGAAFQVLKGATGLVVFLAVVENTNRLTVTDTEV